LDERARLSSAEEVARSRDPDRVRQIFDRVAPRYDLANHLLSIGFDFWWRERAANIVAEWKAPCVLDVATGSGDLALAIRRKLPASKITGVDFSADMLARARSKGLRDVLVADALELPLASQAFDAVTIAFGLRNMRDWPAALREMHRILTGNGHLLVLDFSLPPNDTLRAIYRFYLHKILPQICRVITGEADAYAYLGATIESFPSGRAMCELLEANGFRNATAQAMTGGIVTLYTANKL
jgi:demethylmenaquinone methyltransferase/2-methoxy-6-polyprenyl-1,4-benzoquinol methylase